MIIYNKQKVKCFFYLFLSSQTLQNILKIFLKSLAQQKGIERNLLIKKFIKNILYSKDQIQINLYYSKDFDAFKKFNPSFRGWVGWRQKEKGISVSFSENPQFVMSNLAPLSKTLRTVPIILPNTIHQSKERNLKK